MGNNANKEFSKLVAEIELVKKKKKKITESEAKKEAYKLGNTIDALIQAYDFDGNGKFDKSEMDVFVEQLFDRFASDFESKEYAIMMFMADLRLRGLIGIVQIFLTTNMVQNVHHLIKCVELAETILDHFVFKKDWSNLQDEHKQKKEFEEKMLSQVQSPYPSAPEFEN